MGTDDLDLGRRIAAALGESATRQLLDVLSRSEADRSQLIEARRLAGPV